MTLTCSDELYFVLFPTCVPVKGAKNSILMDLDKSAFLEIPNQVFDFLKQDLKKNTVADLKKIYNHDLDEGIEGYLNYLAENQYGFFTDDPSPFFDPPNDFHSPYDVISSVLSIDTNLKYNLSNVFTQLDELSCQLIQIRAFHFSDLNWFSDQLEVLKNSTVRIIELFIPYSDKIAENSLLEIANKHERLKLVIYNAPESKKLLISNLSDREIVFTEKELTKTSKEVSNIQLLTISYSMYYEALHHNTGLNRKVCVDSEGNIKNYLSHKAIFGNVNTHSIKEIISKPDFQEKYNYKNDQIEKCKDCQFRYMCLNNSDVIMSNNKLKKINSCSFNPYSNTWN